MKSQEHKLKALFNVCGWQGGTIHQVADELGITTDDILTDKAPKNQQIDSDYMGGQFAFDTCSLDFTKRKLKPKYFGNADFWKGYMKAAINKYPELQA